ncbi:sulfate ABC transporter permease subunit, partial [bacterium]|nr:sulfate ABC transporter permease subunit [bacterium]
MIRLTLTVLAVLFLLLFLVMPLVVVGVSAFEAGLGTYIAAVTEPEAFSALMLTLKAAAAAVVLNTIFGIAAAWLITNYQFPGKNGLITLIDLPFTISPVVSGLLFVLLLGARSPIGEWLVAHDMPVIFATPGIILATCFVTLPFIARELIPLMQSQGNQEEEAAVMLGANGWQLFFRITLPKIKWGLLYGVILAAARAVGEFGAVSVV